MTHDHSASFIDISGHETKGRALVEDLELRERFKRASLRGATFFGIAFVGIFVPFLHFVITPAFAIVGIVAFVMTIRQEKIVPFITGDCPSCGAKIEFRRHKFGVVLKDVCPSCRQMLKIHVSP